ncbi:MAG: HK97 family phage prohead protease [Pseudomonadota bacterium]
MMDNPFEFAGYASVFSLADLSGDRVQMGAFGRSLKARGPSGLRMLWNHDPAEPIGVWTAVREDLYGLYVEGHLTPGVERAQALTALIKDGAVDGLSIGFHTVRADRKRGTSGRRLIDVDLWEISLVAFPMQPGARITRFDDEPASQQTPDFVPPTPVQAQPQPAAF